MRIHEVSRVGTSRISCSRARTESASIQMPSGRHAPPRSPPREVRKERSRRSNPTATSCRKEWPRVVIPWPRTREPSDEEDGFDRRVVATPEDEVLAVTPEVGHHGRGGLRRVVEPAAHEGDLAQARRRRGEQRTPRPPGGGAGRARSTPSAWPGAPAAPAPGPAGDSRPRARARSRGGTPRARRGARRGRAPRARPPPPGRRVPRRSRPGPRGPARGPGGGPRQRSRSGAAVDGLLEVRPRAAPQFAGRRAPRPAGRRAAGPPRAGSRPAARAARAAPAPPGSGSLRRRGPVRSGRWPRRVPHAASPARRGAPRARDSGSTGTPAQRALDPQREPRIRIPSQQLGETPCVRLGRRHLSQRLHVERRGGTRPSVATGRRRTHQVRSRVLRRDA